MNNWLFNISVGRRPSLAGPDAAKIRRPKIWTAELAGQIVDGRPNVRPIFLRAATLAVRKNQRQKISLRKILMFFYVSNLEKQEIFKYYI